MERSNEGIDLLAMFPGAAHGSLLVLDEPLSFWGGMDRETGELIDRRHPQCGAVLTGHVLCMPSGRGSSSSTSVLAEAIRLRTAPAAIITREPDVVIGLGALVAYELYGRRLPVGVVSDERYRFLRTGLAVTVTVSEEGGRLEWQDGGTVLDEEVTLQDS
jgi:uncharacterized protein